MFEHVSRERARSWRDMGAPPWRGRAGALSLGATIYITHTKFAYTFVQFLVQET